MSRRRQTNIVKAEPHERLIKDNADPARFPERQSVKQDDRIRITGGPYYGLAGVVNHVSQGGMPYVKLDNTTIIVPMVTSKFRLRNAAD